MASIGAAVVDGKIQVNATPNNTSEDTTGSTALGKDAFLKLLVTQMQYQDPLNPSSDTEWIAQMAQFSSLEEMQNMGQTMTNTQAFQLVGQYVIVDTADSSDTSSSSEESTLLAGQVEYVTVQGGKALLSMDGTLYEYDQLDSVVSSNYIKTLAGMTADATTNDVVAMLQDILDQSKTSADAMAAIKDICDKLSGTDSSTGTEDKTETGDDADSEGTEDTADQADATT